jgi:hypothetical protein
VKKLFTLLFVVGLLSLAAGCPPATTSSTTRATTPPRGTAGPMGTGHTGDMGTERATERAGPGHTERATERAGPGGTEKATEKKGTQK